MAAPPQPLYQVDAFTGRVFAGNPAAVCPLEAWPEDSVLQAIAAENNLSETAFFIAEGEGFGLRWFTPLTEVALCGHATLASAYVIFTLLEPGRTAPTQYLRHEWPVTVNRDRQKPAVLRGN